MIPPSGGRPPSPRVRELAERLSREIEAFRQERRNVTDSEVRAALRLASQWVGRGSRSIAFLVALLAMVAALGVVIALSIAQEQGTEAGASAALGIAPLVGILAVVLAVAVVLKRFR